MENRPRHRAAHGSPPGRPATRAVGGVSGMTSGLASSVISWVRGHLVPVALMSVLAVGLVAGIVVFVGGSESASSSSHVVGSKAAGAQAATTVTRGSGWLASSGAKQLSVVNADVARLMAAERAAHRSAAAKAAGARLAAEARAALGGPKPPVEAAVYRSALQRLEAAGSAAAAGQLSPKASRLLQEGEAGLMKVAAAADAPVSLKAPAILEPNGQ
jgi:hypothetical protein